MSTRKVDLSIDIAAPLDHVWRALTDARELTRWFPLEARVEPGEGGSMYWGWGDGWAGESRIVAWEPNRRLRLVETRQTFDADGKPLSIPGQDRELIVEVTLESYAGATRLRLVHSGFGAGADWDDELDGVANGWHCELRNLRLYVESHFGRDRHLAWAKASTALPADAVWRELFGPGAVTLTPAQPREGDRYALTFMQEHFEGTVALAIPNDFLGIADNLHRGMVRVGTFRAAGRTGMMLWAVSYDAADAGRLRAFQTKAEEFLAERFATRNASV
ncbi:MAG TPA: SRPBCC domain-containing protein [Gemmatimonadaceae bacterium]|nr:SRPBCC domain-containing protein [Gemmatimonadaceae bacterium]